MRKFMSLLLCVGALFCFVSFEAKAQMPASEITIYNTHSSYFKGTQFVYECVPVYVGAFDFYQPSNSALPHYYNGVVDEYTYEMMICDEWGNCVMVGAPGSGSPQVAVFPTGDKVVWHFFGCGHPSVFTVH